MMPQLLLTLFVFTPGLAIILMLILYKNAPGSARVITLVSSCIQFLTALLLFTGQSSGGLEDWSAVIDIDWISLYTSVTGHVSIDFFMAVDGLNSSMVLLSGIVLFLGSLASWNVDKQRLGYFSLFLLLSMAVAGCFVSIDMVLFYLFFEFMLLPMYFLIGIWGGPKREYAAIKFFLFTLFGSVLILLVIIGLYLSVIDPAETAVQLGYAPSVEEVSPEIKLLVQDQMAEGIIKKNQLVHSLSMADASSALNYIPGSIMHPALMRTIAGFDARYLAFLALFIGFIIKLPSFPFHTWLPVAHVEASTPISIVLAGILLKIGGYGLIRMGFIIFPDQVPDFTFIAGLLGMISILYAAYNALIQADLKKLIAFSSISHMGFVLLGLASVTREGISGAIYQLFSHGLISSMLFILAGVLYDRTHDRFIEHYKGLSSKMPVFSVMVAIAFFASLGLPGFSGFIAEIFVFLGAFSSVLNNGFLPAWISFLSVIGVILSAAYYLWTLQKMFLGKYWVIKDDYNEKLKDLTVREYIMLVPLALSIVLFGIFPSILLDRMAASVSQIIALILSV